MKAIIFSACMLLAIAATAQQDSTSKKSSPAVPDGRYCVLLKDGKIEVTENGKPIQGEVVLKNGNRISATGTVIKKNGNIEMIKPGTCVNAQGNETEQADTK